MGTPFLSGAMTQPIKPRIVFKSSVDGQGELWQRMIFVGPNGDKAIYRETPISIGRWIRNARYGVLPLPEMFIIK